MLYEGLTESSTDQPAVPLVSSLFAPGPCESAQFAPWNFRSLAFLLPGLLAPLNFHSNNNNNNNLAPWPFRSQAFSLPGTKVLWNFRSFNVYLTVCIYLGISKSSS